MLKLVLDKMSTKAIWIMAACVFVLFVILVALSLVLMKTLFWRLINADDHLEGCRANTRLIEIWIDDYEQRKNIE